MKLSSLRPKFLIALAGLSPALAIFAPPQATAEVFFRPFGFAFHRPIVEPEPDVSPRRIAAILARRGFRLVGPLGYRGQQIVATGVDIRGARERFLVDPYEGEVLSSWRVGPPFAHQGPSDMAPAEPYGAPEASIAPDEPRVIPGIGADAPRHAQPKASTPPRAKTAARPSGETSHRAAPHPAPSQATKAAPAAPTPAAAAPSNTSTEAKAPAPAAAAPAPGSAAPTPPSPQSAAAPDSAASVAEPASAPAAAAPAQPAAEPKTPGAATDVEPKPNLGG